MRRRLIVAMAATAAVSMAAGSASAAGTGPAADGGHAGAHGAAATGEPPHLAAFREASDRMHAAMDIEPSGNPDVDFVRGMIGHHAGAIEMARVVLEHGTDPEIRALAEQIVSAQEQEIERMREWLDRHEQ